MALLSVKITATVVVVIRGTQPTVAAATKVNPGLVGPIHLTV